MGGFSVSSKGSFNNMEAFLRRMRDDRIFAALERYGKEGVAALRNATPEDSGETASAWYYEIVRTPGTWSIVWGNNHVENGRPIAILLQYGHGTRTGGFVQGRDYINDALRPIFDRMAAEAWKEVTK